MALPSVFLSALKIFFQQNKKTPEFRGFLVFNHPHFLQNFVNWRQKPKNNPCDDRILFDKLEHLFYN